MLLQVAYKDKEVPVLSIEDALKREGRASRLGWEEVTLICLPSCQNFSHSFR